MAPRIKRHERIIALIREHGFMPVEKLARQLDVTPQTVRRDISQLCEERLLRRYHGGAALGEALETEDFLLQKNKLQTERAHIADVIASQIPDRATLFMSIGTNIEAVAKALVKKRSGLSVVTNNIHVASILSGRNDNTVMITSGVVRPVDGGITGLATVDFINQFKVDYAVLSASGIEEDGSLFDFDYKEVSVMQAMMNNARTRYLAADAAKFGRPALVRMGDITEFDAIFTDVQLHENLAKKLHDAGVSCFFADRSHDEEDA